MLKIWSPLSVFLFSNIRPIDFRYGRNGTIYRTILSVIHLPTPISHSRDRLWSSKCALISLYISSGSLWGCDTQVTTRKTPRGPRWSNVYRRVGGIPKQIVCQETLLFLRARAHLHENKRSRKKKTSQEPATETHNVIPRLCISV